MLDHVDMTCMLLQGTDADGDPVQYSRDSSTAE